MFTFSETEYKWCVECQGNIRKDAYYCKFCRKPIGSKILQAQWAGNVSAVITGAAHWLPNFDDIYHAMPAFFSKRFDEADANTKAPYIGLKPGVEPSESRNHERNSKTCNPDPPTKAEFGLIVDVLISLHAQGAPLSEIFSDVRLQLLELSVGEIVAEHELRVSEIKGGQKCSHCAEFVVINGEPCRFCGGSDKEAPKADPGQSILANLDRYDPTLLRNILVWESAKRRIDDEEPINAEILAEQRINQDEIDRQILTLRQNPKSLPHSRWRERMVQLGINPGYFEVDTTMRFDFGLEFFEMQDIASLGRALTPDYHRAKHANADQALIVLDHGLTRWQTNRHYEEQRHNLLSAKSMVYLSLRDDENYKRLKNEANQALLQAMPEELRGVMEGKLNEVEETMLNKKTFELDPEERLKALESAQQKFAEKRSESLEQLNELMLPGLAEIFQGIGESTNRILQIGKHSLKGQSALKKSDYETACAEFEAAIKLVGDTPFDICRRSQLWMDLADAQSKKGDRNSAEASFQNALSDAADVDEATFDKHPLSHAHHKYACYLRDSNDYAESENHFEKAFAFFAEVAQDWIEKGYLPADASHGSWLMKEDYAKLLRSMGRHDEAERVEIESQELKLEEERRKQSRDK